MAYLVSIRASAFNSAPMYRFMSKTLLFISDMYSPLPIAQLYNQTFGPLTVTGDSSPAIISTTLYQLSPLFCELERSRRPSKASSFPPGCCSHNVSLHLIDNYLTPAQLRVQPSQSRQPESCVLHPWSLDTIASSANESPAAASPPTSKQHSPPPLPYPHRPNSVTT